MLVDKSKQVVKLGLGFRLPFGSFEDVPNAQIPRGEGMVQYRVRFNYDLQPIPALMLSVQSQVVGMINPRQRKKSSLLNPNSLSAADPLTKEAIDAAGDGASNSQVVTKRGVSQEWIFRANLGLAF